MSKGVWRSAVETAEMIKIQHTVFALPFAVISLITAAGASWPEASIWIFVLLAMVSARTAAMSFNRLADQEIDAANPRTASRALPAGRLRRSFVVTVTVIASAVFITSAAFLNRLCLILALPTLAILLGYSFAKRFTPLSHLWLGGALGLAPVGAWIAVTGGVEWPPVVLGGAVLFWVAGFDVIYALQDNQFDRTIGLKSLPSVVGPKQALQLAKVFHVVAFAGFVVFAFLAGGGVLRYGAVVFAGGSLIWQHRLVSADDLSTVNAAFFSANGFLALVMCLLFVFAKMPFAL